MKLLGRSKALEKLTLTKNYTIVITTTMCKFLPFAFSFQAHNVIIG